MEEPLFAERSDEVACTDVPELWESLGVDPKWAGGLKGWEGFDSVLSPLLELLVDEVPLERLLLLRRYLKTFT